MAIKVGDKLPEASFKFIGDDGPEEIDTSTLFDGRKVVLFAVPGAFTPTCNANHLPGYLTNLEAIKAKGVDEVAVVSVNDMWVMNEWAKASGARGKIRFLSDGNLEFTNAVGMEANMSAPGFGMRSKRYSMIVEDGMVTALNIEQAPGTTELSGAAAILEQL